jgi:hypothetical protein
MNYEESFAHIIIHDIEFSHKHFSLFASNIFWSSLRMVSKQGAGESHN